MLSSLLTRFISSKSKQPALIEPDDNPILKIFALSEGGEFFPDFKLFHKESVTSVDTLIFLPNFGIFLGETISWCACELEDATVERSSKAIKRPAATNFDTIESKIRSKLNDILSFDSTPIHRFIWMKNLTEAEFDELDSSFHELLPKTHLLFCDESVESVKTKLYSLGEFQQEPFCRLQIIGALNAHLFIPPTTDNPFGALLSPQQNIFLSSHLEGTTTLIGGYGSGKSTLLLRKALLQMLCFPKESVMIITPTLLGGELLRNKLLSLVEYGVLDIDFSALHFYTPFSFEPEEIDRLKELKKFQDVSMILCDDAHLLEESFIEKLDQQKGKRSLLLTSILPAISGTTFELSDQLCRTPEAKEIYSPQNRSIILLLLELRKTLANAQQNDILIAVSDEDEMILIKEAIDEYFNLNCRILISSFSLQYQNLDSIIITTLECIAPLCRKHLLLVKIDPDDIHYSLALSRASETLTIISCEKSSQEISNT